MAENKFEICSFPMRLRAKTTVMRVTLLRLARNRGVSDHTFPLTSGPRD